MDTGQYSNVSGFGLMYHGARWPRSAPERGYDPALGRFAQADTVVPGGVQGYDRYAYVSNDPIRYVDPDGHKECDPPLGCSGRLPSPKHPAPKSSTSSTSPHKSGKDDNENCKGLGCAVSQYGSSAATIPTDISTVATATSVPNWRKIAVGVGLFLFGAIPLALIVAGILATGPAAPAVTAEMLISTEVWMPIIYTGFTAVIWHKAFEMIREGVEGK